jgi:hypothetical protein
MPAPRNPIHTILDSIYGAPTISTTDSTGFLEASGKNSVRSPDDCAAMGLTVRHIRRDDGLRLRALRLHALTDAPSAFGSTLAREETFPESVWHERAAGGAAGADLATVARLLQALPVARPP